MGKKLLSLLLALVMVVMVLPVTALAAANVPATVEAKLKQGIDVPLSGSKLAGYTGTISYDTAALAVSLTGDYTNGMSIEIKSDYSGALQWTLHVTPKKEGKFPIKVEFTKAGKTTYAYSISVNVTCDHSGAVSKELVPASCKEEGRKESWYCDVCHKWSTDKKNWYEEETQGYIDNIVIKKLDHVAKKVSGQPQTCSIDGKAEHYQCEKCGMLSLDGKEWHANDWYSQWYLDNIVIKLDGKAHVKGTEHRDAIPATCTKTGRLEFWLCRDCNQMIDADGNVLKSAKTEIDPANHPEGACILYPAKAATCGGENSGGYDSYWYCSECKKYFLADDVKFEHPMDDTSKIWHSNDPANHVEGKCKLYPEEKATCTEGGIDARWFCSACSKYYTEDDVNFEHPMDNDKELKHEALGHDWKTGDSSLGLDYEYCARENCGKLRINGKEVAAIPGLHSLKYQQEIPATCAENGTKAYWYCVDEDCGMKFADLEATKPVTDEELVIPAGHNIIELDAKFPNGYPYYYCTKCGSYFEDQNGKTPAPAPAEGEQHILLHHEAVAPSCQHGDGNNEYWECVDCGEFYGDAQGTTLIAQNTWVVPYRSNNMAYHKVKWIDESTQYIGRNECEYCHMCFDENGKVLDPANIGNTTNVAAHSLKYHPAVAATCTTPGNVDYYECIAGHGCEKYFADSAATKPLTKDELVTTVEHSWLHFNGIPATIDEEGQQGYSYCTKCHMYKLDGSDTLYTEEELRQNWGIETLPDKGEAVLHKKVAPTCTEPGMKKHWTVENLRDHSILYYLDAAMSQPTTLDALTIPAAGHKWVLVGETATTKAHKECSVCHVWADADTTDPTAPGEPEGGFEKPTEPPATTPEGVIKDDMDLSGMHMSTILGKGNEP